MKKTMMRLAATVAAVTCLAASLPGAGFAQQRPVVTLKSLDGFTQLRGELVDFDGSTYTISTPLGTLQVDALQVRCEGDQCPKDEMFGAAFAIAGSNTIGDALMPALIEGYAFSMDADMENELGAVENESVLRIKSPDGREMAAIDVKAHGSNNAFQALADNAASIAMSSRVARDAEVAALAAAGIPDPRDGVGEHIVALDALTIVVHPDNPVQSLSTEDIAAIFGGDVTNWSEVGGPDMPINVNALGDDSGTMDTFNLLVLRPSGYAVAPSVRRFDDNAALSDAVSSDPAGIGITSLAYTRAARVLAVRQECGIVSSPTSFSIKTEEYPLVRRLYLYENPKNLPAHARNLIRFAQSDDAQPIIEESGFVSLSTESRKLADEGERILYSIASDEEFSLPLMREMIAELRDAQRLSFAFRFTPGSSRLDPKSLADVKRLAEMIARGEFAGREVLLVGFTDAIGQFDLNRGLAVRRAQGVLDEIALAAGPAALATTRVTVQGFGELTPVGCNETFQGRFANRRVEVWVRDQRG
ncbi:phosphate ABC transporter substrate-binding/OmpA family protein [Limibaculum sp. M0105]|uniref:Phosphate ABC transporter substrate-binding/OmpA family protein n=1 Tax=Thermohalobaculum xanthum TaxID=2753746 RepID=A0A8J7M5J7_9RHOB|nr:phosphate ABC transporter substrate-binding/OmpA family protein [Thermohalobaculum xanthum]MBK0398605.1 phosphate ABC transporter substrate-binding/OmpA family protein [Thermohalobaculum xanthum]